MYTINKDKQQPKIYFTQPAALLPRRDYLLHSAVAIFLIVSVLVVLLN